jgi:hypothetical protein
LALKTKQRSHFRGQGLVKLHYSLKDAATNEQLPWVEKVVPVRPATFSNGLVSIEAWFNSATWD